MAAQEVPLLPRITQSPERLVLGSPTSLDVIDPFVGRESSPQRRHQRVASTWKLCCSALLIMLAVSYLCASGLQMQTSTNHILLPVGALASRLGFPALVGVMMGVLSSCLLLPVALWCAWQKGNQNAHLDPYIHGPLVLGVDMGRLPDRGGGCYLWVRARNGFEERALRRKVAHQTLAACRDNGYRIESSGASNFSVRQHVKLEFLQEMINQTTFVGGHLKMEVDGLARVNHPSVELVKGAALDVAVECSKSGEQVVIVNAASAYHPGGGFHTGGRHALEESLCVQSTLFASLEHAYHTLRPKSVEPAPKHANKCFAEPYIPKDQVILSPDVEVFRGGAADGYPFWWEKVRLSAVVSVAMPNCNPEIRNTPVDKPGSNEEYKALVCSKYKAMLCAVMSVPNAEVLVMPSVGCGVFKNDPHVLGAAFAEVLRSVPCTFKRVLVADQGAFGHAVCRALERDLA